MYLKFNKMKDLANNARAILPILLRKYIYTAKVYIQYMYIYNILPYHFSYMQLIFCSMDTFHLLP